MLKRFIPGLVVIIFLAVLISCGSGVPGSGESAPAPPNSVITVNPPVDVSIPGLASVSWATKHFQIVVTNVNGIPLNDVEIYISYLYAVPHADGYVQLYDGNTAVNSPFKAKTDENGVYNLRFDFQSGGTLAYAEDIVVTSGSSVGTRGFEVTAGGS